MQYAPKRTSDGGARRPFASVENHFMGRCRSSAPGMFSDMCARRPFASVGNHFMGHRVPLAGRVGAYCIRPFKWPRRGQIRRRRMPVGRYCFLPEIWGAYAFAPLHGRPTMAAVVHSPPKCFPIAADTRQALLFSARNIGGVCMPHKSLSTTGKTENIDRQRTEKKSRQTLSTFCLDFSWIRGDGIEGLQRAGWIEATQRAKNARKGA